MDELPSGVGAVKLRLGQTLRRMRERTGLTMDAVSQWVGRSRPTLWKIESGHPSVVVRDVDITALGQLYHATPEETAELMALAAASRVKGWTNNLVDILPADFRLYAGFEGESSRICSYDDRSIPGLLQNEGYARTVLTLAHAGEEPRRQEEIAQRLARRMKRGRALTRARPWPLRFDAVIDECVLRRVVGGPAVMAYQLQHLIAMSKLPNVGIRVLPFNSGVNHGMMTGAFVMYEFPPQQGRPLVYAEGFQGATYLWDRPNEIRAYQQVFESLARQSLDDESSRDLIRSICEDLTHRP